MNEDGKNYWQGNQQGPVMPVDPTTEEMAYDDDHDDKPETSVTPIQWQASEYIHHEKDGLWFVGLIVGAALFIALSIFLIKSWTFTALVVVMAVAVIFFAVRPPRTLSYTVSPRGLQINERMYNFHEFRAFGVLQEGPLYSIVLIPVKRFMPSVTVYFPQDHGEDIVDILGTEMPMETVELDTVDRLVRKLRF